MKATAVLGMLLAVATAQEKVVLRFYGEAGCPPCQDLIVGPLETTLNAPGLWGILDYQYIPFGNAFFITPQCGGDQGYNLTQRLCWDNLCGGSGQPPAQDCFVGDPVCQHGPQECYGNVVEVCLKNMTGNDPQLYQPFVHCWEGQHQLKNISFDSCAEKTSINAQQLKACAATAASRALLLDAARETAGLMPAHESTPWVLINGKQLTNTNLMLKEVCTAYTGPPPTGCAPFVN
ncbi:GILT-like protein C02D5.2 [Diplonema papillatum]|nr:GILT-like protein C02D5.2 [Diplonema papillatum]|eukprot:gene10959-16852_t